MPDDPDEAAKALLEVVDGLDKIREIATGQRNALLASGWPNGYCDQFAAMIYGALFTLQARVWSGEA